MPATIEHIDYKGLPALRLSTQGGAIAIVSLFGGQVLSWTPPNGRERLYLSPRAHFDGQHPIRGGVPVCFPQFASQGPLPQHGFARTATWSVTTERSKDDFALITLGLTDSEDTRALWPHRFRAEISILIEDSRLDMEFEVENMDEAPLSFTAALHTYLAVKEVEECRLEGLHGYDFLDKTADGRVKRESGDVVLIEGETDRVYHGVKRPLLLREYDRSLGINADGFADVVVWNPWVERSAALADLPDDAFRRMLCVEAAAVREPIRLDAGELWWGRQTLVAL